MIKNIDLCARMHWNMIAFYSWVKQSEGWPSSDVVFYHLFGKRLWVLTLLNSTLTIITYWTTALFSISVLFIRRALACACSPKITALTIAVVLHCVIRTTLAWCRWRYGCSSWWSARTRCTAPTQVCGPDRWRGGAGPPGCPSPSDSDPSAPGGQSTYRVGQKSTHQHNTHNNYSTYISLMCITDHR